MVFKNYEFQDANLSEIRTEIIIIKSEILSVRNKESSNIRVAASLKGHPRCINTDVFSGS